MCTHDMVKTNKNCRIEKNAKLLLHHRLYISSSYITKYQCMTGRYSIKLSGKTHLPGI